MPRFPPYLVIDDFLPADMHADLLAHALGSETKFEPTKVRNDGHDGYDTAVRQSWTCKGGLGGLKPGFAGLVEAQRDVMADALGIPRFAPKRTQIDLVAHRHGAFFKPHIDTFTASSRDAEDGDRVITLVYYFHAQPRRFTGGTLNLFAFASTETLAIEPADNRLVAFPSFATHEVSPVSTPEGDRFDHARFAVNVWFCR